MRESFAFHITGDAHLGALVQYGLDDWGDGAWASMSPAISNLVARRWFPPDLPANYVEGAPRNLGDFIDSFGNFITYRAVANPRKTGVEPRWINDFAPGYNILNFDTGAQTIEVQAWPRWVDPKAPGARQFEGWPVTLKHTDNGYPNDGPSLPTLDGLPTNSPIVQVIDEETGAVVYTVRFSGEEIAPRVFAEGTYTVRILDPDMNLLDEYKSLTASEDDGG